MKSRLILGVLTASATALIPFISAQAQDAISNEVYAQLNQVQNAVNSGILTPSQASDLLNRYNNLISKDQQWSAQDGGNLNVPDRLDLQGQLKKTAKRLQNDLQSNGYNGATAVLPGLSGTGLNGLASNPNISGVSYNAYQSPYNQYGGVQYPNFANNTYLGYGSNSGGHCMHRNSHNMRYPNQYANLNQYGAYPRAGLFQGLLSQVQNRYNTNGWHW